MNKALQPFILGLAILVTIAASHISAGQNGHYRWTDADGTVQYSDRPPEGIEAEFIKFSTGKRSKTEQKNTSGDEDEIKTAGKPQQLEVMPEKDPALCQQAQNNLTALKAARIRISEADGSKRILTEDEKESQRENARKFIKIHC
jgi:hypothetical protein